MVVSSSNNKIRNLMNRTTNIRNISVIAHTGHGKSTLKESLASKAGAVYAEVAGGEMHFADSRQEEERDHGTTIKSTAVSTSFELGRPDEIKKIDQRAESREFLINMIDSPGGFDFPSVLTAALYVTDGALLAVDCIDGIGTQTVTALRIALTQRIKPALVVNKIDRAILELKLEKEELYNTFARTIESINAVISTYTSYTYDTLGDLQVHPEKGNVTFASGLHGWGFTLRQFASRYFKKFGVPQDKLMERLWGENYFDPKTSKWTNKSIDIEGKPLERAFNMFILDPIYRLYDAIMHFKKEQVSELLEKLDIQLSSEEKKLEGKQRMKAVMHKFLPCRDAALEMVCIHLPSPVTAQSYRVSNLYQGPLNDECADGIRNCDSHAPLMIYVFKMVPTPDKDRLYALGRVFSGTARADQKVRIMGPNYPPDSKDDLGIEAIQQTVQIMDGAVEAIENCPAGNIVGLVGVDQCLVKSTSTPRKWLTA